VSERLACRAVGLSRSTHRRLPQAQTPADPDVDVRAWLRAYATKHPCHAFRRAWAALRHDEGRAINVKKVHRFWCEAGPQRRVHSPRKRAGTSSVPEVVADAPKVLWALDFQFDSSTDGKAIKMASMVDEHTRESLLHLVERAITAERLVGELEKVFAAAGGRRGCCGWTTVLSWFLKRCNGSAGTRLACPISRPVPRGTTATSNRSTTGSGRSASTATTGTPCSRPGW